jgi:hypothetical protein
VSFGGRRRLRPASAARPRCSTCRWSWGGKGVKGGASTRGGYEHEHVNEHVYVYVNADVDVNVLVDVLVLVLVLDA